jgi:hypothetical protein
MMAQMPKARPLPKHLYQSNDTSLYATNTEDAEIRTLD